MTRQLRTLSAHALIVTLAALPASLAGQAGQQSDTIPIRDLVVRALRAPLPLSEIPYGVSALGPERLSLATSGTSMAEALRGIPGVQLQNRYNFAVGERVAVRGFGVRAQFGVRGLSAIVDGIPATMPDGQSTLDHVDPGTLTRAEVVPGPASALWGNAAGGVVRLETLTPTPGPLQTDVDAMVGSDGLDRFSVTASGSGERVGYAVSLSQIDWEGFRPNPRAEGETYGDATRRHAGARIVTPAGAGTFNAVFSGVDLTSENPSGIGSVFLTEGVRDAHSFSVGQRTGKDITQLQLGLGWSGPQGDGRSLEFGGWILSRDLTNPIPSDIIGLERLAGGLRGQLSGEFSAGSRGIAWTAGAEFGIQDDDRKNWENDGGDRGTLTLDQVDRVMDLAAFLQLRAQLTPRLLASGGVRADRVSFEITPTVSPDAGSGSRTMSAISPTLALLFEPREGVQVFANVGTSFETPTTTELVNRPEGGTGLNEDIDPATGWSREVGTRFLVSDRLSVEARGFMVDIRNELVPFEDALSPGRTFFRNAGRSSHRGLELAANADLGSGFGARASWSWTDAEFDRFTVDDEDFAGNSIPGLAPQRAEAALTWSRPMGLVELRTEYVDHIPVNDANAAFAPSYLTVDLRGELRDVSIAGTRWSPYLGITNLLDESYVASVVPNAFGGRYYEPAPERSFFLGARVGLLNR